MVMPAIIALFQIPSLAFWMLLIMTVYQQILLRIVMPKVMSEVVGMPPLPVPNSALQDWQEVSLSVIPWQCRR